MSFRGDISAGRILATGAVSAGVSLGFLGAIESQYYAQGQFNPLVYGFCLYAMVGFVYGFVYAFLLGGKGRRERREFQKFAARSAVLPSVVLVLVAGGFLIYRDLWRESISRAGFWGWAALVLLPVGAIVAGILARAFSRFFADRARSSAFVLVMVIAAGLLFAGGDEAAPGLSPELTRPEETKEARPPIILVVVDALRADALGVYGSKSDNTPHLDAFARESIVFDKAWSGASWTRPAVATILTGQYPSVHQTTHKADRLPENLPTLASRLKAGGYVTVASVTNVNLAPVFGMGRGFDAYAYHAPRPFLGAPAAARRLLLVELYRLARLRFFPGHREVSRYYAEGERISETAKQYLDPLSDSSRSFFAYLHYMEAHDPYFAHPYDGRGVARVENVSPPVERAAEFLDLYGQEVRHWDGLFGDFLKYLKEKGLYHRSVIIVTADHGEEFADHGGFWHGTTLYQELVRVPLIVRLPQGEGGGSVRKDPVSLVDLMPTFLQLARIKKEKGLPGRSLLLLPDDNLRRLFAEEDHQGAKLRAVFQEGWKLIQSEPGDPRGQPGSQLFNLEEDPLEQKNLAATNARNLEALGKALDAGPETKAPPPSVEPKQVEVDSSTEEQLRSLGYTE